MKCFSCNAKLGTNVWHAITSDGQKVYVGRTCAMKIIKAGDEGWQPKKGGPRLFKYQSSTWNKFEGSN